MSEELMMSAAGEERSITTITDEIIFYKGVGGQAGLPHQLLDRPYMRLPPFLRLFPSIYVIRLRQPVGLDGGEHAEPALGQQVPRIEVRHG